MNPLTTEALAEKLGLKPQTLRAALWSRNRTKDTRIFNPLLYQLS